ncbi:hypothetical protein ES702_04583 [subsurface metagenome]
MSVRVQLDHEPGDVYTNLDFVRGRVILILPTDATVSAITVKLEGESKSRLDGPKSPQDQDRKKTLLEAHKLLYKVETVFPSAELRESAGFSGRNPAYTLLRGQYEYPFQFKIPFNSDCVTNTNFMKDLKVGQLSVQFGQEPLHAKFPLPPTLTAYPGEAEIKYFVKATVVRPKFYQQALRNEVPIIFLPIEQPRPKDRDGETYGRRKHQFQGFNGQPVKRKSLFRSSSGPAPDQEPLAFQVDARLPDPAIITCREPLPLRIIIERLNSSTSSIYLSMLQIELIGNTEIRAHDLHRKESGTWLLVSQANLSVPLEHPSNKSNVWTVPPHFWENVSLPSSVVPTFRTCNISRTYELEVRIGLSHGMAEGARPEIIVSPIRLEVQVWSGMRPPQALLDQIEAQQQSSQATNRPGAQNSKRNSYSQLQPQSPVGAPPSPFRTESSSQQQFPPPLGRPPSHGNTSTLPTLGSMNDSDLPPSYEDAMAADLTPIDGPRPSGYNPNGEQRPAFNPDSKSAGDGLNRRVSERLFATNAPRAPRTSGSRSSRVASTGDLAMSRFGDDIVHEEPDDIHIDEITQSYGRQSLGNTSGHVSGYARENEIGPFDDEFNRPALPARESRNSKAGAGGTGYGESKGKEY